MFGTLCSHCQAWVPSLVGELRSWKLQDAANKQPLPPPKKVKKQKPSPLDLFPCYTNQGQIHIFFKVLKITSGNNWKLKWQPTPVFLPGQSHGQRNLVDYSPWGRRVGHDWVTSLSFFLWGYILIVSHSLSFFLPQMEKNNWTTFYWWKNVPLAGYEQEVDFCKPRSCLVSILHP